MIIDTAGTELIVESPAPPSSAQPSVIASSVREPVPDPYPVIVGVHKLSMSYGGEHYAIEDISLDIRQHRVTAFIGPSGCGKSTLLRCFNRLNDLIDGAYVRGVITFNGVNVYDPKVDVTELRKRIGMVFQKSNPFPKSIYDNVAYGPRLAGVRDRQRLGDVVEHSLRSAALWDEVQDRLHTSALGLSGGQQQRLCIARALAVEPDVILMDEPCSALDPIATAKIESLIHELKERYTIVIVTHNMQQAARVSDFTAFLYIGRLVEYGPTDRIFTTPEKKETEDYITGRFG